MTVTRLITIFVFCLAIFILFFLNGTIGKEPEEITIKYQNKNYLPTSKQTIKIRDVKDEVYTYDLGMKGKSDVLKLTKRSFPNDDYMIFIQSYNPPISESIIISILTEGEVKLQYKENQPIEKLYPYRKKRILQDPLSTTMNYFKFDSKSILLGPQIYFNDISEQDENGHKSNVLDFQREAEQIQIDNNVLHLFIDFKNVKEEQFSTWLMVSKDKLFKNKEEFLQAYSIGVDEFRWITPDSLWSHGLTTIHPQSETAFIRSLVRQSGRSSSIQLEKNNSRFWENINRHQFVSLELSRNDDGLWYTDYISTWLQNNYNIGAHYVDSRHNDNIFRSQLRRAKLLGYTDYLKEISVYADFLLKMANEGYVIGMDDYFYIIDYFDFSNKTHVSLNHALSMINYLYDAYLYTKVEKYLSYAEVQLRAIEVMEQDWLNEDGEVNYQLNLDGTVSGKDYNLVTYYDLLYTKKLRNKIGLKQSITVEKLLSAKQDNLNKSEILIDGNEQNVEDFIGLIE